jgi:hypothetical protein
MHPKITTAESKKIAKLALLKAMVLIWCGKFGVRI